VKAKIKRKKRLAVPAARTARFLSFEERRLLRQRQSCCPICLSTRIHVYAERWAGGKPVAGCRACNRLFSLG